MSLIRAYHSTPTPPPPPPCGTDALSAPVSVFSFNDRVVCLELSKESSHKSVDGPGPTATTATVGGRISGAAPGITLRHLAGATTLKYRASSRVRDGSDAALIVNGELTNPATVVRGPAALVFDPTALVPESVLYAMTQPESREPERKAVVPPGGSTTARLCRIELPVTSDQLLKSFETHFVMAAESASSEGGYQYLYLAIRELWSIVCEYLATPYGQLTAIEMIPPPPAFAILPSAPDTDAVRNGSAATATTTATPTAASMSKSTSTDTGADSPFDTPSAMAVLPSGDLVMCGEAAGTYGKRAVWTVDPRTGVITPIGDFGQNCTTIVVDSHRACVYGVGDGYHGFVVKLQLPERFFRPQLLN